MTDLFYYDRSGWHSRSRWEAMKREHALLYFHDQEFTKLDWKHEPSVSLSELYRERAASIRSQYEYIIVGLSGGHDSTNMLQSFVDNDIPVDEVVLVGALSQDDHTGSDFNHNGEIYYSAMPLLQSLEVRPRVTFYDYAKLFNDPRYFTFIRDFGPEWYKHVGSMFSVNHIAWRDITKATHQGDKKAALVLGADKPTYRYDGRGFTQFNDVGLMDYGGTFERDNVTRVNFYTSVDCGDIIRKQLHIINGWYHENVVKRQRLSEADFYTHYSQIIHRLIYALNRPIPFVAGKAKNVIFSPRDRFMINCRNSDMYKFYAEGIMRMRSEIPKVITDALEKRSTPFLSRRYYLS